MSNALEPRVSEIMFNDSFMNQNGALTISHVNGDAEGSYHCGMSAPASLCLLVRGRCVVKYRAPLRPAILSSVLAVIFVCCKFSFVQREGVFSIKGYTLVQYVI